MRVQNTLFTLIVPRHQCWVAHELVLLIQFVIDWYNERRTEHARKLANMTACLLFMHFIKMSDGDTRDSLYKSENSVLLEILKLLDFSKLDISNLTHSTDCWR